MARSAIWTALLVATLLAVQPARADFEAGQRAWDAGRPDEALTQWRAGAWVPHAEHGNTRHLRRAIFRDGWFDPSRGGLTVPL